MIRKITVVLAGIPATFISLLALIAGFLALHLQNMPALPADPAWLAVIISGIPLLYDAADRLLHAKGVSKISSSLLIVIAMTAAIIIGDLFAAGEVAVIMAIGSILEEMTVNRTKRGVQQLLSLAPAMARRITDDGEEMIPAEELSVGDIIRILPGEAIPADGVIISGETSVDQSIMTGESLPVDKETGDDVFCGTINRFGTVDIRAVSVGSDSSLQKMARMVQEAENSKTPTVRLVDRFAAWMVPSSLAIALAAWIITGDPVRSVTVLLVFCPCAMVLATPTAIMAAIGQAAKHGVLIKSGAALEAMAHTDTVTFDKTGTLTYGKLDVSDIVSFDTETDTDTLLSVCASAESRSEHPLARAVLACAQKKKITVQDPETFQMAAGKGISADINGRMILCGSERCLNENGVKPAPDTDDIIEALRRQGKALILMAAEGRCIGVIALSDTVRKESAKMIYCMDRMGARPVLLTGDHQSAAGYFASELGIKEVRAGLLPEDKAKHIALLQKEGRHVCMTGDGVNDAVALKTAEVGIAMGSIGSDIAIDACDIALMSDDISRLPYLRTLSAQTVRTIKLGIAASMTINLIALALSLAGMIGPTAGALIHNVGSCLVVMFAGFLYDRDLSPQETQCSHCRNHTGCGQRSSSC